MILFLPVNICNIVAGDDEVLGDVAVRELDLDDLGPIK
jgi:hypothetical protein